MSTAQRLDGRKPDQLRTITFEADIAPHATGSVLVSFGLTRVICAATIEPGVPTWMKQQKVPGGWLTAEYSMLPYSTLERKSRDISRGKIDGRTVEIQRLIGRSLRAVIDLNKLGQNTLWLDCDVLQADGGTRTASITGAYLAARLAVQKLLDAKKIPENPLVDSVAAISAEKLGLDDLTEFLNERLARYKHPKILEIVESLPRNPAGKVLKNELRARFGTVGKPSEDQ